MINAVIYFNGNPEKDTSELKILKDIRGVSVYDNSYAEDKGSVIFSYAGPDPNKDYCESFHFYYSDDFEDNKKTRINNMIAKLIYKELVVRYGDGFAHINLEEIIASAMRFEEVHNA